MNTFRTICSHCWCMGLASSLVLTAPPASAVICSATETNLLTATNSYWTPLAIDPALYDTPYHISLFNPQNGEDSERVYSQTKWVFLYGVGVLGILWALPEDFTGWDTDDDLLRKYGENIHEGPVWDRDEWYINFIGHPYIGGVYYQIARKSGYRQWDSFLYSFLMSAFYWEYGIEATAETPSIQDLVVHPILGWVYGEWAYQKEREIRDSGGEVAGSKTLGAISLAVLDPIDALGRGINYITGRKLVKAGYGYLSFTAAPTGTSTDHQQLYLNMHFSLDGEDHEKQPIHNYVESRRDPVTSGIVGFSVDTGYTLLDKDWGVDNGLYTQGSLGLYFTPRFSTRMSYAYGDFNVSSTNHGITYENYSLTAQYYFNCRRRFRPFITTGFGEQLWDRNRSNKIFQLNAGIGLHYQLHDKLALQTYWINNFSPDEETNDQSLNAGFIYRFAQGEHDLW